MRIADALEKFLVQLQANGRSHEDLGHEDVAAFLASPVANTRAGGGQKLATSQNCLRSSLKGFFAYLHRAGYISHDPGRMIRRARCAPPPPRALSDGDQGRLLSVLEKAKGPEAERDHMLFHLLLSAGLRVGSAVALDVDDVDIARGALTLRSTKGNAPDVVPLGAGIRRHLRRYLARRSSGPLFTGRGGKRVSARHVQRRLAAWAKGAGIDHSVSPHCLRHSLATSVYRRTGDILLVKEVLRHKSIASTMVYARVSPERLRRAL